MEDDTNGARRQLIEANLTALYGPQETQDKIDHRSRVVDEDGTVNGFQESSLRNTAIRRQQEEAVRPAADSPGTAGPPPSLPEDLEADVPDPEPGYTDRVDVVAAIKAAIGIEGAVRRWGKPQPGLKVGNRTEGIHVRCPFPHHVDNDPSAWINTTKGAWFCGGCQVGGDQIDWYAAAVHGLTPAEFHSKDKFPPIIIEMAEALGIDPDPPQPPPHLDPEPEPPPTSTPPPPEPEPAPEPEPLTVAQTVAGIDPDSLDFDPLEWDTQDSGDPLDVHGEPEYDWRNLDPPPGTFLHEWMTQNVKDLGWIAPEFFMMLGLQAIGLACGHRQYSQMRGQTTTGTMGLILVGLSGSGKSTAAGQMRRMFAKYLGSKRDDELGTGIRIFRTPASSEALLKDIYHEIEDPVDPSKMMEVATTAWMFEDEFATLVSKAKRPGAEHIKQRFIELLDFYKTDPGPESSVTDSSVTRGKLKLHDSFFSACFCTQNDVLRTQIQDYDMSSGFMNRLIPVFGKPLRMESPWDTIDPDPDYIRPWGVLWDRLQGRNLMDTLPVSGPALSHLAIDPYMRFLNELGLRDGMSLVARLKQHMHQIAFLLAVNENGRSVDVRHYKIALHMTQFYLQPCYASFFNAAKATRTKDLASMILIWTRRMFDRDARWPSVFMLSRQRFWKAAEEYEQETTMKALRMDQRLTKVFLTDGRRSEATLIATDEDDKWGRGYRGKWDNKYQRDGFYANT